MCLDKTQGSRSLVRFPMLLTSLAAFSSLSPTDIDECSTGLVECDSRAACVNLPGWYHCECRDGYHDNGMFAVNGESCEGKMFPLPSHLIAKVHH